MKTLTLPGQAMRPSQSWERFFGTSLPFTAKYRESVDALVDSFNPKQKKWFEEYQKMVTDELWLAEQRRFVCGFKTAMRLALESMK